MSPLLLAIVGGVLVFGLLLATLLVFAGGPSASERLAESSGGGQEVIQTDTGMAVGRSDPMPQVSDAIQGTAFWDSVQMQLLRAGLLLRPSEAMIICTISMVAGLVIGWLVTGQAILGILTAGLGLGAPYMYMVQRASRRQAALTSQLPDALDMLSSALRSGYALTRGFQVVSSQMHPPIADEFQRVLQEVQVGISVSDALEGLLARSDSYDLELVVAAMQTQLTMGGNLSEVLDNIAGMIRERVRLQGEIDAATSEGRMSAGILVAMPIIMALVISAVSPGYLNPLFEQRIGLMLLMVAGGLMITGVLIIKKMLDIDI
ncbi:MAG: secretion system protein [Armatimonadia bacterium]|nr:secretion system protein [Armatimonadia bacterium]